MVECPNCVAEINTRKLSSAYISAQLGWGCNLCGTKGIFSAQNNYRMKGSAQIDDYQITKCDPLGKVPEEVAGVYRMSGMTVAKNLWYAITKEEYAARQ